MDFEYASIALLGSMVLVLAGLVGWLYWQQTRMFQSINNLVMVVGELASRPSAEEEPAPVPEPEPEPVAVAVAEPEAAEDDRVSVDGEVTLVEGPPATATTPDENDTDELEGKTKKELQDILTKRGIPFSKSDAKGALISLLKATA
jgi:hypothetical protein